MVVSIDAGIHWVDRENILAFLEVKGSKLKEKYNIWCKNELPTSFWWENTSWYPKTWTIKFYVFLTYDF